MIMKVLKFPYVFYAFFLFASVFIAVYFFKEKQEPLNPPLALEVQSNYSVGDAQNHSTEIAMGGESTASISAQLMKSPERNLNIDNAVIAQWKKERGYAVFVEGNQNYDSYNLETLEKLANDGDGLAVQALARVNMLKGFDNGINIYQKAAVKGSTEALALIAASIQGVRFNNASSPEEKKAALIESLAWDNVAALRGDRQSIISEMTLLKSKGITIETADQAVIKVRAQEIYNELQQERNALGLGDFDNSVPDAVRAYFDDLEAINGQH
jgi:hypothetical protein